MKATGINITRITSKMWEGLSILAGGSARDFEEVRRRSVLALFLMVGIAITFPFGVHHFSLGNETRAILLLCVGSVQLASLLALHYLKRATFIFRLNVILLGAYFLFLIALGGTQGSRILWVFIFPLFAFFLLGKREGFLWSALLLLLSLVLFMDPGTFFGTYPYENEVRTRFLITYIIILLMSYIVEATRQRYQRGFLDYTAFLAVLAAIRGVVQEKSEEELWDEFLSSVVEEYGFLMAWYGQYSDERVVPKHSAGHTDQYLDNLVLEIRERTAPDAQCAMSRAILDSQPFGYANLARDEGFGRWRDYALELGYRSNLALPLKVDGQIEGGIMVYAGTPSAFPKERVDHLLVLASEMGNALKERRQARQAREALKEAYGELEKRVEERTAELRDANETLKKEIRDRILAEETLKAAEQEKELILSSLMEHVIYEDRDMKILWANRAACESAGMNQDEILGRYCFEIWAQREDLCPDCPVQKAIETGEPQEIEKTTPDGKSWVIRGYPVYDTDDDIVGGIEVTLEITERKRAEAALKEAYDIINKSPAIAFLWKNEEGWPVEFVSENVKGLFGITSNEFISGDVLYSDTVHPDDLARVAKEVADFSGREGMQTFSHRPYRILTKDGEVKWVDDRTYIRRDEEGNISHYQGIVMDITDRMHMEVALRQSEERFRELAELLPETIYEMDSEACLTFINRGASEQFGYTQEDFDKGLSGLDMLIPKQRKRASELIGKIMQGQEGGLNEYTALRKDGTTFPVLIRSNPIMREGRAVGIRGIIIDISEKKKLEEQLLQAQKMEAVGTLAGGIAHDFNNILMGIQGRTSLMLLDTLPGRPHYEHLTGIEEDVKTAAGLTKQLLGFARGGKYEVKPMDLNRLVVESSELFGRTEKEIRIHRKLSHDIRTVEADQVQIEQVLLNLYVNAWQAMPGGGELFLQTENVSLTERDVEPYDVKAGGYVKITVTDTGVGMDEATQRRIFDPFFTTKEMGRGTGLGLASAYGIIRNHGGFIKVSSEQGKGSTFQIYLPASDKEIMPVEGVPEDLLKGEETVLLVDDETMIIDVGKKMLERLGYHVLVARGGEEAIEVYRNNEKSIRLVILDLIMPEMGGGEVYDRLKEINPNLKVLLASGYSIDGEAKEIMARGCDGFIQKPFNMHGLSQTLRAILGKT